ncbi:hypothetical protein HGRIS_012493 [Hohenbuehelia grisea]|uniref:SAP domain-containing protein n=1 Tax=Hohenbuehelia grisea TaxID=104357 RepID=A0ABR3ISG0_9AGAR
MSTTTTQILFNPTALQSLKRDQLVKLCKVHSIKASGKNVDLIEKLKQHGLALQAAEARRDDDQEITEAGNPPSQDEAITDSTSNEETQDTDGTAVESPPTDDWRPPAPRPSEQWEIVMESIEELDEESSSGSSQNTLTSKGTCSSSRTLGGSTGEFGTGSSKASSVSSSIKALASSFGLNRMRSTKSTLSSSTSLPPPLPSTSSLQAGKEDDLLLNSTPYSALPLTATPDLPRSDNLKFTPPQSHLPGAFGEENDSVQTNPFSSQPLRTGVPAPSVPNARLSLGLGTPMKGAGPSTTVRLVSSSTAFTSTGSLQSRPNNSEDSWTEGSTPKLKPYSTTFDLVLGSPAPLYPALPLEDLGDAMPGMLNAGSKPIARTPSKASSRLADSPQRQPFVFGSPLPQHRLSNAQFQDAAKSVLEEMNKRLQQDGVSTVSTDILQQLGKGKPPAVSVADTTGAKSRQAERQEVRERFKRAHEDAFGKMAGINERPTRSAPSVLGQKRKSNALDDGTKAGIRRRPSSMAKGPVVNRAAGTRVISGARRKARAIPGGFGEEEESGDDDGGDADVEAGERAGKRVRLSIAGGSGVGDPKEDAEEAEKREKEREAIKRKLEISKARRRSSMGTGRQSMGRGRVSTGRPNLLTKPKPKPSRFGFLSSAKSLVQGVWNRGKTTAPPAPATTTAKPPSSSIPVPASKPVIGGASNSAPNIKIQAGTPAGASSSSRNSRLLKPDAKSGTVKSNLSARSRSPIPSFGPETDKASSRSMNAGTTSSTGIKAAAKSPAVSSVGTRMSVAGNSTGSRSSVVGSRVSSMGTRASRASVATNGDAGSKNTRSSSITKPGIPRPTSSTSSRASTSRLMAPTASSLAKTNSLAHRTSTALEPVNESGRTAWNSALGSITNNHGTSSLAMSPSPKRGIFHKQLSSPSSIPTPIRTAAQPMSLGAASAALTQGTAAAASTTTKPAVAPKPRSLSGRKPRISRSKVIAKLASQRAASGGVPIAVSAGARKLRPSVEGKRTRSSLGVKVQRQSLGGGLKAGRNEAALAAKRKARASEYARRRSTRGPENVGGDAMDTDDA